MQQARVNVDTLRQSGDLVKSTFDPSTSTIDGYDGLGFQGAELQEFRELKGYLKQQRQEAIEDTYPVEAIALLNLVYDDPEKFARCLNFSNHSDNRFHSVPILAYVDPETFVGTLTAAAVSAQWTVLGAIRERYAHEFSLGDLIAESNWLRQAAEALARVVAERKGKLSGDRLLYIVEALEEGAKRLSDFLARTSPVDPA
ncbi:hypothetical protein [Paraburkholderia tropica]|uniref:hypothetical protein n=1 Tax=Paraburkholderia tropica TaxID=92647 RepID=UPI002ABE6782|nr:hypothetical protein [Paraburkholderia tropica]